MKLHQFLIIALLTGLTATAQQKKWTLQECVAYALENNISVLQSELNVEQAEVDQFDAFGNFLPTLNANASNAWQSGLTQNITTGVLETQTTRNFSAGANVGVDIFRGLQNQRQYQRAKIAKLASDYNLEQMKNDIALNVANSYLQALLNKQNLKVIKAQNEVTQQQIQQTSDLVEGGVLPQGDLLEIQATNANELQQIVVAENQLKVSLISLAQLLLIKDYENFDVVDTDYEVSGAEILTNSAGQIVSSARENRFEIKIAEQNAELAKKDLQISRAAYYPTLSGFMSYNTRESDRNRVDQVVDPNDPSELVEIGFVDGTNQAVFTNSPNFIFNEIEPLPFIEQLWRNDGLAYGFQLNVPIFNGFAARNNVKRRKIALKNAEYQLEQTELDLESNVYQAYVDAQGALKSYEAALTALESQELAYQYATDRYDVGLTNAFDFSQSKLRYDNAKIEVNRSKYDYIFRLKVLELFFGVEPTSLKF
ncbi:TolC family protein [Gangjinia marincola]|uniref:TolC family protein n=1 Tax=Gangjinia marincola TaxID=578463 RepID=A0ABN1MEF0_9FLAO